MSGFGQPPGGGGYGQPPGGGYPPPPGAPPGPPPGGFGQPPGGGGYGQPPGSGGFGQQPGGFGQPPAPGFGQPPAGGGFPPPAAAGGGDALEKVKIPGLLLMIYGGISLLFSLLNIGWGVISFLQVEDVGGLVTYAVSGLLGIVCNAIVIFGGSKMRKLQGYGLAMAACILAMLPCTGWCCIFGLAVGIWGIVILLKDEVKTSFT
jgi:hypothetical protein